MDMLSQNTEKLITVEHLTKSYVTYRRGSGFNETVKSFFHREKVIINAVDDVSFDIRPGEIVGILGPNGAGKSTTIKMLTGALYPSSGSIEVMGFHPLKDRQRYVRQIGAVFGQKSQLIWDIPPIDSFRMNQAIYGIEDADFRKRLNQLTAMFDVADIIEKPTRVLSLGERMKCEFIMAMLHAPKIVFLDEPTIGLDVIARQKIREFIREMNRLGTTFILTTHDLDDVEQLADRVIIINHGKKVFDGSLKALQQSLGNKKLIELTLSKPLAALHTDGIELVERRSDLEVVFEADLEKCSIAKCLQVLSETQSFSDISIRALPMETIITGIYQSV